MEGVLGLLSKSSIQGGKRADRKRGRWVRSLKDLTSFIIGIISSLLRSLVITLMKICNDNHMAYKRIAINNAVRKRSTNATISCCKWIRQSKVIGKSLFAPLSRSDSAGHNRFLSAFYAYVRFLA